MSAEGAHAVFVVPWQLRQRAVKKRLTELDRAELCISCNGTNLVCGGEERSKECGHIANLAFFQPAQVQDGNLTAVTSFAVSVKSRIRTLRRREIVKASIFPR